MTFKSVVIAVSVGVYSFINAQEKIYFDADWEVTTKDKMEYYREYSKKGDLTLIKDFYKNGVLQMEGNASNVELNEEVWEGPVTWYYPNGKPQTITNYKNGREEGVSKSYNENGKITEDYIFNKDGQFSGRSFVYKNEDGNTYNAINEFKDSELAKEIVYDDDINKIRYESKYSKGFGNFETKFFDGSGKNIGTKSFKDYSVSGVDVSYYYSPMQVRSISKYGKNEEVINEKIFYRNGSIAQEKNISKKDGFQKTYDQKGNVIGELVYAHDKFNDSLLPYNGTEIWFFIDSVNPERMVSYKDGMTISEKVFNEETQKVLNETTYADGEIDTIKYFENDGTLKSSLIYKDGLPYQGNLWVGNSEAVYNNGVFSSYKIFSENGKLIFERKFNEAKNIFDGKIYNDSQKLIATYTMNGDNDAFTGTITQYENGKVISKATIKDDYLVDGKVSVKTNDQKIERERNSKWSFYRIFDEKNALVEESKKKIENSEGDNSELMYFPESNLYENFLTL